MAFKKGDRVRFERATFSRRDNFYHKVGTATEDESKGDVLVRWDDHHPDAAAVRYRADFLELIPAEGAR